MLTDRKTAISDVVSSEYLSGGSASGLVLDRISIETLNPGELDQLPFGAVELDSEGNILQYNDYESKLAGITKARALGRNFFTEIAPCTKVREFFGRFQEGVAKKKLHEKFRYHFSFKKNPRDVTVTLFYSESSSSVWVFIRPV